MHIVAHGVAYQGKKSIGKGCFLILWECLDESVRCVRSDDWTARLIGLDLHWPLPCRYQFQIASLSVKVVLSLSVPDTRIPLRKTNL
jgi:hypothetical protein